MERDVFSLKDFVVDYVKKVAFIVNKPLILSKKEFDLLEFLVRNKNRVVSRVSLLEYVWNYNSSISSRTIDVHIYYLKKKMGDRYGRFIRSISKVGYIFVID